MRYLILVAIFFSNTIYSQTTHQLNWNISSTNQQITIGVGDTVVWTWGSGTHNLRSTGGTETFDSGYFTGPGPQFSYTFTSSGITTYICDPHPNSMYGTVTVTETASEQDLNLFDFILSPNPVNNAINLSVRNFRNGDIIIEIYDVLGRLNKSLKTNIVNNSFSVNVSDLNSGVYIIKLLDGEKVSVKRFIKK